MHQALISIKITNYNGARDRSTSQEPKILEQEKQQKRQQQKNTNITNTNSAGEAEPKAKPSVTKIMKKDDKAGLLPLSHSVLPTNIQTIKP